MSRTEGLNTKFIVPLPYSEVKSISKSIANYVIRHFSPEKFRESQAIKGRKGGLIGGKRGTIENKAKAGALGGIKGGRVSKGGGRPIDNHSMEQLKPWDELGISRATYYRNKNK